MIFKGWKGPGVVVDQDGQFVLSQAVHKQEHIKKDFCKGSSSSHGVDETEDGNVITFEGDEQDDISDSGNVPGHVESNLR